MDRQAFEQGLRADGYEAVSRDLDPSFATPEHTHPWDTRGLVLDGEFEIEVGGAWTTYRAGEIFEVPAGVTHSERHGASGGRLLVGRRRPGSGEAERRS